MQSFPKTRPWFKRYKICARGEKPPAGARKVLGIRLATSRPHEFLSERSGLFRPRRSQASDQVRHIKSDGGLFWKSTWGWAGCVANAELGSGRKGTMKGGGEGTQGLQTYLKPGTKPSLNHQKRSLIEKLATFWRSNIEQDDEYEPNLYTFWVEHFSNWAKLFF